MIPSRALVPAALAVALGFSITFVGAQAPDGRSSAIPRTADGRPNLAGVWQTMNTAAWDIQDHNAAPGVPAGQGVVEGNDLPYRPEMLAKKHENFKNRQTADPETKCYMPGVPRTTYMPFPFQIVQTPKQVTMLYEVRAHGAQHLHGHAASARPSLLVDGRLARTLGRRHACR